MALRLRYSAIAAPCPRMRWPAPSMYRTSQLSSSRSARRRVSAESSSASFAPTITRTGFVNALSAASLKTGSFSVRGLVLLCRSAKNSANLRIAGDTSPSSIRPTMASLSLRFPQAPQRLKNTTLKRIPIFWRPTPPGKPEPFDQFALAVAWRSPELTNRRVIRQRTMHGRDTARSLCHRATEHTSPS